MVSRTIIDIEKISINGSLSSTFSYVRKVDTRLHLVYEEGKTQNSNEHTALEHFRLKVEQHMRMWNVW